MLGEVITNNLGLILEEIVNLLKDVPPRGFDRTYNQPTHAAAPRTVSFRCNKQQFKHIVWLAELGVNLSEQSIATTKLSLPPPQEPLLGTVVAGLKSLEAKWTSSHWTRQN